MPLLNKKPSGGKYDQSSGKYRKKEPPSPHVADFYNSNVVRHPTAVKRSEHYSQLHSGVGGSKSARSLSVPSLHATTETKSKYSPPLSPQKPRSKSVRVQPAKKTLSFKKLKKFFGSHSELDNGSGGSWTDGQQTVGTYRPLNITRPRSIGGSSDCSSTSVAQTDFIRCNSLRDSSRSRISGNMEVFQGVRQGSYDSSDYTMSSYPNHVPSGSTDSGLRPYSMPYMPRVDMPRSSSSTSLKAYNVHAKTGVTDTRHYSIAAIPVNSEIPTPDERGLPPIHRNKQVRHLHRQGTNEDSESLWEDSSSFTYVNTPVNPSHPEYKQVAKELMSVSPTRKNSNEFNLQIDARRMSETSIDPRRVSNDSGVESSSTTKHNRSLPSTPIAQSFTSVQNGDASTPERPTTPHGYLSQDSNQSLPHNWDLAYHNQGLRYYIDPASQSASWKIQEDPDESSLPPGWELVRSSRYGTYFVNHNNKTAIYQHPCHAKPPPPYSSEEEEPKQSRADRKVPSRSHSQRNTLTHRVLDPNASLPRRSKSFRDQESQFGAAGDVSHERQLSTMTFVPPSPYQIKEIPRWLKEYVESSFGSELDLKIQSQSRLHTLDDLTAWDTMIKRLLKKGSEQIVKQYEYYRVAVQQEIDERLRQQNQYAQLKAIKHHQQQQTHSQHSTTHHHHMHPAFPMSHGHLTSSSASSTMHQYPSYYDSEPDINHHNSSSSNSHNHHHNHLYHNGRRNPPVRSASGSGRHHSSSNLHGNSSTSNTGGCAPFRTQSYNNLPHTNSSGHLPPPMGRQGSGFSDLFESMNSVNSIQPRLSDSDFQGLEETFV